MNREPTAKIIVVAPAVSSCCYCARQCGVTHLSASMSIAICDPCKRGVLDWVEVASTEVRK